MTDPDRRLARKARRGDRRALVELYERHRLRLLGYLNRLLRDRQLAEDVFQEVWLKVLKGISSYRPQQVPFRGWLYRVASNAAVDRLRRESRHVALELDAPLDHDGPRRVDLLESRAPGPDRLADSIDLERALSRALGALGERQRIVVLLRHQQGLTYPEIAGVLGIPEGTVKALVHRGVTAMRERLSGGTDG